MPGSLEIHRHKTVTVTLHGQGLIMEPTLWFKLQLKLSLFTREKMSPFFNEVYIMPEEPILAEVNDVLKQSMLTPSV